MFGEFTMTAPVMIDTKMRGDDGITAAFLVRDSGTAIVETGPKSSIENLLTGLAHANVKALDWIVVTHIHLDHAGAAGTLLRRYPEATVAVHARGAPHLVDPSKLWASAARIYGESLMAELWGGIDPVPEGRIHILEDGDKIDLGGRSLQALETPGHARHHHALLDDATGTLFVGDALGVRLPDVGVNRPATPPPEFDLEQALASIQRIKALDASSLWLTHYGPSDAGVNPRTPGDACDEAANALSQWSEWVTEARARGDGREEVVDSVRQRSRAELERSLDESAVERLDHTTSYEMNVAGYLRAFEVAERAGRASS
jgi:glyoxylase-like metal-dependent hydrolase (beta-lactamase superfamily II)